MFRFISNGLFITLRGHLEFLCSHMLPALCVHLLSTVRCWTCLILLFYILLSVLFCFASSRKANRDVEGHCSVPEASLFFFFFARVTDFTSWRLVWLHKALRVHRL